MALNTPKRMRTTSTMLHHNDASTSSSRIDPQHQPQQQQQHHHHHPSYDAGDIAAATTNLMESPQWSGGQQQLQHHHPYYSGLHQQAGAHAQHVAAQHSSDALQQQQPLHLPTNTNDVQPPQPQQQQQQHHWLADAVATLSPVSSCGSPEFNPHHQHQQHHPQNRSNGTNHSTSYSTSIQSPFQPTGSSVASSPAPQTPVAAAAAAAAAAATPNNNHHHHHQHHHSSSTLNSGGSSSTENNRRGRPRSEALSTLMIEGSTSPSAIKCGFCHRVFPREKSLQAHLRTHTGERPYPCDYPGCMRAFTQSGQLKTHQRLHTGERPFMCAMAACQQRFTHANRHCPDHPSGTLKRCDDLAMGGGGTSSSTTPNGSSNAAAAAAASAASSDAPANTDVMRWLEKYRAEKEDRTPSRRTPKRSSLTKAKLKALSGQENAVPPHLNAAANGAAAAATTTNAAAAAYAIAGGMAYTNGSNGHQSPAMLSLMSAGNGLAHIGNGTAVAGPSIGFNGAQMLTATAPPTAGVFSHSHNNNNGSLNGSPSTPSNPRKSRKGLMVELDMNAGMGASPIATKVKAAPKQIQWTEAPMSQEEDSGNDDDVVDDDDDEAPTAQSTFNPKKRWLREAWQDDLARPLDSLATQATTTTSAQQQPLVAQQPSAIVQPQPLLQPSAAFQSLPASATPTATPPFVNPNQMRPSVLMIASKDRAMPLHEHQVHQVHGNATAFAPFNMPADVTPNEYHRQQQQQQFLEQQQGYLASHPVVEPTDWSSHNDAPAAQHHRQHWTSAAAVATSPNTPNRKWLGAMALMHLATNDGDEVEHGADATGAQSTAAGECAQNAYDYR